MRFCFALEMRALRRGGGRLGMGGHSFARNDGGVAAGKEGKIICACDSKRRALAAW